MAKEKHYTLVVKDLLFHMHLYMYVLGVIEGWKRWSPRTIHQNKLSMGFCENFDSITAVFWLEKPKNQPIKRLNSH